MSIYTQKLNYEEKNTHLKAHRQKKRHWVILILTIFSFFLCVNLISAAGGNWTGKTTPGLIFWSQFENSTGTVLFNEVLGIKNGIINPPGTGVVWNSSGKYNRGISMERITSGGCLYNLSDGTTYSFDDNGENFTIEAWVKTSTDDATRQPILYASSKFTFEIKNGKMYAYDPVAVADRVGDTDFVDGDWHHVAFVYNQDNNTGVFYLDGQRDGAFVYDTTAGNSLVWFGDTSPLAETGFVGTIDDLKVFNNSRSHEEIKSDMLEDATTSGSQTTSLTSPENNTLFSVTQVNLTATHSSSKFSMKNATYSVWYVNGTLFNETTIDPIDSNINITSFLISELKLNNYKWNVKLCSTNSTTTYCSSATNNATFSIGASLNYSSYNTNVFETSHQIFSAKFDVIEDAEISLVQLIYNGTAYSISNISQVGTRLTISKSIDIPLNFNSTGNQTNDFFYRFTYAGITVQDSGTYYQNSSKINLVLCNVGYTTKTLNFTLRDENTLININSTSNPVTWESTFLYWLGNGNVKKNYSYQLLNSTNQNNFTFCLDPYLPNNYTFKTDADVEFMATDYSENEYHLRNATLTNTTSDFELLLFLIDSDLSTKFYITVNQGIGVVRGALVNVAKYFTGEGVYKTVSIRITDGDGEFPLYADLDNKYLFSVTKDGVVLGIVEKTLSCAVAPCEEVIVLTDIFENPFGGFEDTYGLNIYSNLSFDPATKIVTYSFFDITGLANYFRLVVSKMSYNNTAGATLCDVYSYSSAGTLTCNLTGYSGDFIAKTYISRSPELLDKILTPFISEAYEELGLLGIFLNIAIIITVVLSTAAVSRGSPAAIVFMLGITILLLKIGGLFPFSWLVVTPIELILVWLLMKSKG